MKPINVLSLFDGMSCGQIALERAGISVANYYASEIDKYAIKITQCHYPKTVQLGSVTNWKEWIDEIETPDLLIGGSPCQGFSNAGQGLNFDDPRSKLFFTYVDIRNYFLEKNPNLKFLLENVKMKKAWESIITEQMGVEPVLINSALVSAQNRQRLYWANWEITQPEDKHIYLKDIIVEGEVDREKSYTIDANYYKGGNPRSYFEDGKRQLVFEHQSHKRAMVKTIPHGYMKERVKEMDIYPSLAAQDPSSKYLIFVGGLDEGLRLHDGKKLSRNYREGYRIYSSEGKSSTLSAQSKGGPGGYTGLYQVENYEYRKLTPVECERLQTVEDGWTEGVSNTQRYKMLGNGWTIDVIAHIFSQMR